MTTTAERTAPVIDAAPEPAAPPPNITPRDADPILASAAVLPRPGLAAALARAIASCQPVQKQDYNAYHKYAYAGADAIIDEGRRALAGAELALLPLEASLNGSERTGDDRYELVRTFLLAHSSGESVPLRVVWPVQVEKGRPLDKATAIADTLSLSYLIRDLLLLPRVDPSDDVNTREDRPAQQPARKAKPKREYPEDGAQLERWIDVKVKNLTADGYANAASLLAHVQAKAKEAGYEGPVVRWTEAAIKVGTDALKARCKEIVAAGKPSAPAAPAKAADPTADRIGPLDVAALEAELARVGETVRGVQTCLVLPATATLADLTRAQLAKVMGRLKPLPTLTAPAVKK